MLYVKTSIGPSLIQGIGLFAAEPIPAGALIFRWSDAFGWSCPESEFGDLPGRAREFLWRYGWRSNGRWLLDVDNSRFVNHSRTPNMFVTTDDGITSRAARDIEPGEELTEDYSTFDPDFELYAAEMK